MIVLSGLEAAEAEQQRSSREDVFSFLLFFLVRRKAAAWSVQWAAGSGSPGTLSGEKLFCANCFFSAAVGFL